MANITLVEKHCMFDGYQHFYSHDSKVLGCQMNFAVYLPRVAENRSVPVIYWLSGLTCSEKNFIEKSGAQKYASEGGIALVSPDTSPRGLNIPGEDASWDFGLGASFYVDATQEPWKKNYRMFTYITEELPGVINENFAIQSDRQSIMGHSMGGHGALICALKMAGRYRSVSAFAPISNPMKCPWGKKAFSGYFGADNTDTWADWDATELVKKYQGPPLEVLINIGTDDQFLKNGQLLPENFTAACNKSKVSVKMEENQGYDHSYYFVASFIKEHMAFHRKLLQA